MERLGGWRWLDGGWRHAACSGKAGRAVQTRVNGAARLHSLQHHCRREWGTISSKALALHS